MINFFYISGVISWVVLIVIALYYCVPAVIKLYRKYIGPTLINIKVYLFGFDPKWRRENDCAEIYFSKYSGKPGLNTHWHKPGYARRLAFYRFLKEAHKDMPGYLDKLRNNR